QGPGVSDEPVAIGVSVYPNPFTTSVTLRFGLARSGPARIEIFDARGRRVIRLDHGESLPAGRHEVEWSGRDRSGEAAPAGIYFYKVTTFRGAERGSLTLTR
ncbi:MAG: T9SS type A sorting domain-containing protein, partial [Candidatus Eisenbacteria bacterium]|nr:T9SS type A sorting domain-containing protein [Candidatus Eisenbacteria bacterium]